MSSFKKALHFLFVILLSLLYIPKHSFAQESMISDFSYLYMEKLIAIAKENYPRNKVFENKLDIAGNNLSIAKASWLDPFSFNYVNRTNIYAIDGVNSNMLSGYFLNIAFSPSSLAQKPYHVKNARSEIKTVTAERDEYALQLETEVKRRYVFYLQYLNTLKLANNRLIDAEATFTIMKTKYERNEISFKEFNDASTYLTSVKESKISAEANMFSAKFQLEELLTVKLEDIK
ncbi:TolC family protein [Pseudopedobacter beijingensis]|uniref:TolC family protein n=1 Tax=Pseudopedobacter beijingensis TaxID=1207056 RepID=A0ABW4ICX1_9SPHI